MRFRVLFVPKDRAMAMNLLISKLKKGSVLQVIFHSLESEVALQAPLAHFGDSRSGDSRVALQEVSGRRDGVREINKDSTTTLFYSRFFFIAMQQRFMGVLCRI
ncbi:hypothetical protein CEXT_446731 [Caerostris extrusa]|uniref:Uncharacterized protein n=1 Tax=Caerostris extrusa TaxID=172846 RepID=A0AAV4RIF1_CAEEX|nr:hypothetical protein CEXT_446731 [Caerostris extrusa]